MSFKNECNLILRKRTCSFYILGKRFSLTYLLLAGDRDEDENVADEPGDVGHGVHEDRHQQL